jgi:molybdopterin molybdotransferase
MSVLDETSEGREFFTTRTVAQALAGFRPARRTGAETVPLSQALRRVTAEPVTARHPLPGFARSTVDGYAVRAADTYGVSEGLPGYLEVTGAVAMGTAPAVTVRPGTAVAMPTGGAIPPGADAVVMVEYTADAMAGTIEVTRPVAPGDGTVRADEDVRAGQEIFHNGHVLIPQDLAMLAAAGITRVAVHARPVVTILSTGDEVVAPETAGLLPGQVRDATASGLAALVTDAGGEPRYGGIVADDAGALEAALRAALPASDVVVISAGSSVGARDETAGAVARLGPPGIWCHGLAIKPGKPTLLAECGGVAGRHGDDGPGDDNPSGDRHGAGRPGDGRPGDGGHDDSDADAGDGAPGKAGAARAGNDARDRRAVQGIRAPSAVDAVGAACADHGTGVPIIGLPGNPRSALVVFRLVGMPIVRMVGGCLTDPPQPSARARLSRGLASAAGRLDIVQVTVRDGIATPLFGSSALLSVLTSADGYITIPEEATGLDAGSAVEVTLYA